MRTLILLFTLHAQYDHPSGDRWFAADKMKHFFLSAFMESAAYSGLRVLDVAHGPALAGAALVSTAIGVGKEVHDRQVGGDFSRKDLTWDVIGVAAGAAVVEHSKR